MQLVTVLPRARLHSSNATPSHLRPPSPIRLGTIDYLSPEILDCPVKQHPADHKTNPHAWYTNKVRGAAAARG